MNSEVKKSIVPEDISYRGRPLVVYSKIELLEIIVELHEEILRGKRRELQALEYLIKE